MTQYDIIIIGCGPAGLTAGLYCARAGYSVCAFEGDFVGGQASTTNILENFPGFPEGIGGPELMMRFQEQAQRAGAQVCYENVLRVDLENMMVHTKKAQYHCKAMILAMGATRRKLGVEGEDSLVGRGVSYCATCDGALYKGQTVAVVGGSDTAAEDALYCAKQSEVCLIHRRDSLRVQGKTLDQIRNNEHIHIRWNTVVDSVEKTEVGIALHLRDVQNQSKSVLPVAACFVAVGTQAQTDLVKGQLRLTEDGYIDANEDTITSVPGVFAAGDVRKKVLKQVSTAVSDGANAALMAGRYIQGA